MDSKAEELFPHPSFREGQKETLKTCLKALDEGYKNIILDAPTGSGKSAILTALLRFFNDGWYTTPQKSLRQQIQDDEALQTHVEDLKARSDYFCSVTNKDCKKCDVYRSEESSCAEQSGPSCNYWKRKQTVMNEDIAVVTLPMLIIDSMLPEKVGDVKVSFGDREAVAIDEAHGMIEQTREMHAGFDVKPHGLPPKVFDGITEPVSYDANMFQDVENQLEKLKQRCERYTENANPFDMSPKQERCENLKNSIEQAQESVEDGFPWVVNVEDEKCQGQYTKILEIRPVNVSGFLTNTIWNRTDYRIISTATMRHRNNPSIWLKQMGLDPEESFIVKKSMNFPIENRPVITDRMIAPFTKGRDKDNWDAIMEEIDDIVMKHEGMKGICHTSSYSRAKRVAETVDSEDHPYLYDNHRIHRSYEDGEEVIEDWQSSDNDLLFTPSMMEGIDLAGDKGRYNILMKVPFPSIDSTMEYLLNETEYGWATYNDLAAIRLAQAYGRTTRSKDDWSNFIILDESYEDLKRKTSLPEWFIEAEDAPAIETKSIFDY